MLILDSKMMTATPLETKMVLIPWLTPDSMMTAATSLETKMVLIPLILDSVMRTATLVQTRMKLIPRDRYQIGQIHFANLEALRQSCKMVH